MTTDVPRKEVVRVLMATFNGERWIDEQLASIALQTVQPDEVRIFDDGSTDGTLALLRAFADRHPGLVHVYQRPVRLGPAGNFLAAIASLSDGIVVLCDQDDVWEPDRLEVALDHLTAADAVFSNGLLIDAAGKPRRQTLWDSVGFTGHRLVQWEKDPLAVLLQGNVVTGAALAFRPSALSGINPIPAVGWHDYTLAVLLAITGVIRAEPRPLIRYRLHDRNAAGLPPLRLRDRRRSRESLLTAHAETTAQLLELESAIRPYNPLSADRLMAKRLHIQRRAELPKSRWHRLPGVLRELSKGSYSRYGSGLRSVVQDLLAS